MLRTALLLTATCVVACSPTTSGQPESPPPTATATDAKSDDGFPDLSGFTEADHAPYQVNGPPSSGTSLLTPDGMTCWLSSYPMPEYASVSCFGPRPDQGPVIWDVDARRQTQGAGHHGAATESAHAPSPRSAAANACSQTCSAVSTIGA